VAAATVDTPATAAATVELSPEARRLQQAREALELLTWLSQTLRGGANDRWDQISRRLSRTFDQIIEATANAVTLGTSGADAIYGWSDADVRAGEGDDYVDVWSNSRVDGGVGNDFIKAWSGSEVTGGDGDDVVDAWSDSRVDGGAGNDVIKIWSGSSAEGGDGDDVIDAWSETKISGGAGDDIIKAWSNSEVTGGEGDDVIEVWSDSQADGGEGNDTISAYSGSVVTGGRGDDTIRLGPQATAVFNAGDGHDQVAVVGGGTIRFGAGIAADSVRFSFEEDGVRISFSGSEDDSITVNMGAAGASLAFADGTTMDVPQPVRPEVAALSDMVSRLGQLKERFA
jgi:hypothetical protein